MSGIAFQKPKRLPEKPCNEPTSMLTPLSREDKIYKGIQVDFAKVGLKVLTVERVKNERLYRKYMNERDSILTDRKDMDTNFDLNERYLYHGTNGEKNVFANEEIDNRLSSQGCFGNGIYFSDNPLKCAKYAERGDKEKLILLERVILGDQKVYAPGKQDRKLKREPLKKNPGRGHRYYDSVQGNPTKFNEYVIYERRRALIECIITYSNDTLTENFDMLVPSQPTKKDTNPRLDDDSSTESEESETEDEASERTEDEASERDENDTDSDTSCEEDEKENIDEQVLTTSDEETLIHELTEAFNRIKLERPQEISQEEEQKRLKKVMQGTNEKNVLIARFYLVMEDYDVAAAISLYKSPVKLDLTDEEEAEAKKIIAELEEEIKVPDHDPKEIDSLPNDEKLKIHNALMHKFCVIVGLDSSNSNDTKTARKFLETNSWATDRAVLSYLENELGLEDYHKQQGLIPS